MLTKGIIIDRIIVGENSNKYNIRIPFLETAGFKDKIFQATLAHNPSSSDEYLPGDVVIIGFEDHDGNKPIIIGKLFLGSIKDSSESSRGFSNLSSLKVTGTTELSSSFTLGDYTYDDISTLFRRVSYLEESEIDPANYVTTNTSQEITGSKTFTSQVQTGKLIVADEGIEIYDNTTPYVDFHYQNGQDDYTLRLIETPQGTLEIRNSTNNAKITVQGNDVAMVSDLSSYLPLSGGTLTNTLTLASQDAALVLPNNAMLKTSIDGSDRTIYGYDANADNMIVGSPYAKLFLRGENTRPTYRNGNNVDSTLALSGDIPTSIDGMSGGTLTSPLVITGGGSDNASIRLGESGQLIDDSNNNYCLCGRSAGNLIVGAPPYPLRLRGSETRPKYNNNDMALSSDVPGSSKGITYLTTAPTSANTDGGLIIVVLTSEPSTRYGGYIYIITEE